MKYYKCVTKKITNNNVNKLVSAIIGIYYERAEIEYVPHVWTKPKARGTKLFVFNSLFAAKNWRYGRDFEIWECEVKNPVSPNGFLKDVSFGFLEWFRSKINKKKIQYVSNMLGPTGAIAVDSLKLTRKL